MVEEQRRSARLLRGGGRSARQGNAIAAAIRRRPLQGLVAAARWAFGLAPQKIRGAIVNVRCGRWSSAAAPACCGTAEARAHYLIYYAVAAAFFTVVLEVTVRVFFAAGFCAFVGFFASRAARPRAAGRRRRSRSAMCVRSWRRKCSSVARRDGR
jgi:hypothetical protein